MCPSTRASEDGESFYWLLQVVALCSAGVCLKLRADVVYDHVVGYEIYPMLALFYEATHAAHKAYGDTARETLRHQLLKLADLTEVT